MKDLMTNVLIETCNLKSFEQAIIKWRFENFSSQLVFISVYE